MQSIYEQANSYKNQRNKYIEAYNEIKEQKVKPVVSENSNSDKPLSSEDLLQFESSILLEYQKSRKEYKDEGACNGLVTFDRKKYFGDFGVEPKREYRKKTKISKTQFNSNTPEENLNLIYQECIDILSELNIEIYEVVRNLKNFNRYDDAVALTFYCAKNLYRFQVKFFTDPDIYPGILGVYNIQNIKTLENVECYCDLFIQNTGKLELDNFVTLLESESFDDYKNRRFGHLLELPHLFREKDIKVTHDPELIIDNECHLNNHHFSYILKVNHSRGKCYIMPHEDWATGKYVLYIGKTVKQINKTEKFKWKKDEFDINLFNWHIHSDSFVVDYTSKSDFPLLLQNLNAYFDYRDGRYGYKSPCGHDGFQNETHVVPYLKTLQGVQVYTFPHNGPHRLTDKDFNIYLEFDTKYSTVPVSKARIDHDYPRDFYGINFYYDKKHDSENCYLIIRGFVYDMNSYAKKYYHKDHNKNKYKIDIEASSLGQVEIKGTYNKCLMEILTFIDRMHNI